MTTEPTDRSKGLKGTLIILGIYLVWSIINSLADISFVHRSWEIMPAGEKRELVGILRYVPLTYALWDIAVLVGFFRKARWFPGALAASEIVKLSFQLVAAQNLIEGGLANIDTTTVMISAFKTSIVVAYLAFSKRVRNTFRTRN